MVHVHAYVACCMHGTAELWRQLPPGRPGKSAAAALGPDMDHHASLGDRAGVRRERGQRKHIIVKDFDDS